PLRIVLLGEGATVSGRAGDVAEREQAARLLAGGAGRRRGRVLGEKSLQSANVIAPLRREVLLLPRIRGEVVELRDRQIHVLQTSGDHARQRGPTAVQVDRQRLEVSAGVGAFRQGVRGTTRAPATSQQRMPWQAGGQGHPERLENRRQNI